MPDAILAHAFPERHNKEPTRSLEQQVSARRIQLVACGQVDALIIFVWQAAHLCPKYHKLPSNASSVEGIYRAVGNPAKHRPHRPRLASWSRNTCKPLHFLPSVSGRYLWERSVTMPWRSITHG